jgi:hypothetical protein
MGAETRNVGVTLQSIPLQQAQSQLGELISQSIAYRTGNDESHSHHQH